MEPSFQTARIVLYTDLTRADAPIIPLGVLSECLTDKVHGLALKARTLLPAAELAQLSPIMRAVLREPFAYFREEFRDAWDNALPGDALAYLAKKHSASICILPAEDCVEKTWLGTREIHPRNDAVEEKLLAAVRREFDKMHAEDSPQLIIESGPRRIAV